MSELNFELLQENIRALLKKHDLTQNALAEIAGMTQANVSKALNRNESKQFTIDQVFRIAQHFGVSIDELVGNKSAETSKTSPRAMLVFLPTAMSSSQVTKPRLITTHSTSKSETIGSSSRFIPMRVFPARTLNAVRASTKWWPMPWRARLI